MESDEVSLLPSSNANSQTANIADLEPQWQWNMEGDIQQGIVVSLLFFCDFISRNCSNALMLTSIGVTLKYYSVSVTIYIVLSCVYTDVHFVASRYLHLPNSSHLISRGSETAILHNTRNAHTVTDTPTFRKECSHSRFFRCVYPCYCTFHNDAHSNNRE